MKGATCCAAKAASCHSDCDCWKWALVSLLACLHAWVWRHLAPAGMDPVCQLRPPGTSRDGTGVSTMPWWGMVACRGRLHLLWAAGQAGVDLALQASSSPCSCS